MKSSSEYRAMALDSLRGKWGPAVIATLVYFLITSCLVSVRAGGATISSASAAFASMGFLTAIFIATPLAFGYMNAMRRYYLNSDPDVVSYMFRLPLSFYIDVVWTMLYMYVKVFLWSLLFIVPGVIKALGYAMTPFVLADEPQLNAGEAIAKSARMMQGHKHQLLLLELSYLGWVLLGCLTCGIAFLWIEPYVACGIAAFYEDVKLEFEQRVEME